MAIKKNRFNIAEQERSVIARLSVLNEQKQSLLAELANGDDVTDQLDAVGGEIAELEQKLATFKQARAARAAATSDSARKARHDGNVAKVKSAHEKGRLLVKLSADAIKHVAALGKQLEEIAAVRNDFVVALRDVLLSTRECEAGNVPQRVVTNAHEIVFNVADVLTLRAHFQAALYNIQLGQVGIHTQGVLIERLTPPDNDLADSYSNPTNEIEHALAKLDKVIGQVAEISERANSAKAA
jgi:hypothetical protein